MSVNRVLKEKLTARRVISTAMKYTQKSRHLEDKLTEVLASNEKLASQVAANDTTHL